MKEFPAKLLKLLCNQTYRQTRRQNNTLKWGITLDIIKTMAKIEKGLLTKYSCIRPLPI